MFLPRPLRGGEGRSEGAVHQIPFAVEWCNTKLEMVLPRRGCIIQPRVGPLMVLRGLPWVPMPSKKHFREAVRAAPRFTEAWVNLAATLGLQSRFTEAQDAVTNALRIDPQNPQALLLRDTIAKALAQR